jgi:uncharacterized membrane protein
MSTITLGLFNDSNHAGMAVSELKEEGFTKEISVLAHNADQKAEVSEVKKDVSGGTSMGSTVGAVAGALMGIFSGITSVAVPGVGLIVGGPLVALLGVTGGALGSLAGGLVGALVDLGVNEPTAKVLEERIKKGEVLVGVSTDENEEDAQDVKATLSKHGATDIYTFNPTNNSR